MNVELLLERLARVEGRVEEHSRMVEDVPGRLTKLEGKVDRLHSSVDARFDALGADVSARFGALTTDVNARFGALAADMNARFTRADERMDALAVRMDALTSDMNARFERLGGKIDGVHGELDAKMTRYFTWMIGLTMTAWLSLMIQGLRAR